MTIQLTKDEKDFARSVIMMPALLDAEDKIVKTGGLPGIKGLGRKIENVLLSPTVRGTFLRMAGFLGTFLTIAVFSPVAAVCFFAGSAAIAGGATICNKLAEKEERQAAMTAVLDDATSGTLFDKFKRDNASTISFTFATVDILKEKFAGASRSDAYAAVTRGAGREKYPAPRSVNVATPAA